MSEKDGIDFNSKEIRKFDHRFGQLRNRRWRRLRDVEARVAVTPDHLTYAEAKRLPTRPVKPGEVWGQEYETGWFFAELEWDPSWEEGRTFLSIHPGGEAVCLVDGVYRQGIDDNHRELRLRKEWFAQGKVEIAVESHSFHWFPGTSTNFAKDPLRKPNRGGAYFDHMFVMAANPNAHELYVQGMLLRDVCKQLPQESLRAVRCLDALGKCLDNVDWNGDDEALDRSLEPSLEILRPLMAARNGGTWPTAHLIGHSHIDVAWLWTVKETVRKCARTFSTVDALMDEYPDYLFLQSQAALYEIVKERFPELYGRIRKRVEQGRWEANGGMWVEADCNVPSGESLIRQFLVGKAFFAAEFGGRAPNDVLWLPDVFGYSANLPQILRGCEVPYFCTSKIGWSDTNTFPFDTFRWRGVDGTEVLTSYIKNSYCGFMYPKNVHGSWANFRQKAVQDRIIYPMGFGDGGGGPDRFNLEMAARSLDLEGAVKLEWGFASDHFRRLDARRGEYPIHVGELYLELHRGTLTSQAATKLQNRRGEFALRAAELWSAAWDREAYPAAALLRAWKDFLVNQFHDIIPGSSYGAVYAESDARYAKVFEACREIDRGLKAKVFPPALAGAGPRAVLVNPLPWERRGVQVARPEAAAGGPADIDHYTWSGPEGASAACQKLRDGSYACAVAGLPSLGYAAVRGAAAKGGAASGDDAPRAGQGWAENGLVRVEWDAKGKLTSIRDLRAGRELVPAGAAGNDLVLYEDLPLDWDAWDVDRFHASTGVPLAGEVTFAQAGPLAAEVGFAYRFGASSLKQVMRLYRGSARIDFRTEVDWRENHKLLKVLFPTTLNASEARFEIQYGHVVRAAHDNTSWERAKFEVPGHKWIDMSEGGYGASLINDCKYAHNAKHGVLSTTLLKSAKAPDPAADMGRHEFAYALFPHVGGFGADVVREAYEFNVPMEFLEGRAPATGRPERASAFAVDAANVVVEAVKRAEDGRGTVVRVYETTNAATRARLAVGIPYGRWAECNMLERPQGPFRPAAPQLELDFRAFEIKTLYLED